MLYNLFENRDFVSVFAVALLAEGVDRNPATAAMVTAPDCGHMMYGSITQMDYGKTDYTTYAAKRVAKLVVDQDKDTRKLRLGCRPLAAPKTYCPYIYAADVVG